MHRLSWADVSLRAQVIVHQLRRRGYTSVCGVPSGGLIPAVMIAERLDVPLLDEPRRRTLVVDDLVDSGRTLERYADHDCAVLWRKSWAPTHRLVVPAPLVPGDAWVVFPWEHDTDQGPEDAVVRLLSWLGEDPAVHDPRRLLDGLQTPEGRARFLRGKE